MVATRMIPCGHEIHNMLCLGVLIRDFVKSLIFVDQHSICGKSAIANYMLKYV